MMQHLRQHEGGGPLLVIVNGQFMKRGERMFQRDLFDLTAKQGSECGG
jgi:hypothetical protein